MTTSGDCPNSDDLVYNFLYTKNFIPPLNQSKGLYMRKI